MKVKIFQEYQNKNKLEQDINKFLDWLWQDCDAHVQSIVQSCDGNGDVLTITILYEADEHYEKSD